MGRCSQDTDPRYLFALKGLLGEECVYVQGAVPSFNVLYHEHVTTCMNDPVPGIIT